MTPSSPLAKLAEFGAALSNVAGLDAVVDTALESIDRLLGFEHVLLLIDHRETNRLTTLASRGYDSAGVGSEVRFGEGVIGKVAETQRSMRIGNLQRMLSYLRTVEQSAAEGDGTATMIQLPGLSGARSQVAAPMVADGVLLGVIAVESERSLAFDEADELMLTVAAQLVAGALERAEISERIDDDEQPHSAHTPTSEQSEPVVRTDVATDVADRPVARLRYYRTDGSTFIDDEYVIKGVAGRILWKLATEHIELGRVAYTNREARLDPALELPSFRDNFESRLVLLKRRLDERGAPLRISRTGRGRFEVHSTSTIVLERIGE